MALLFLFFFFFFFEAYPNDSKKKSHNYHLFSEYKLLLEWYNDVGFTINSDPEDIYFYWLFKIVAVFHIRLYFFFFFFTVRYSLSIHQSSSLNSQPSFILSKNMFGEYSMYLGYSMISSCIIFFSLPLWPSVLFLKFHVWVRSYDNCLSLIDLFHLSERERQIIRDS